MKIIWYNPQTQIYQLGSQVDYDIALSNCPYPDEMMVLYELDKSTEHVADKIVKELNAVRTELKSA